MDSLVDVGGGVGGAAISIAAAFPCMKCSVLDLPHVVAKAPAFVSNVQFVAGDMFESIPQANIVFLKVLWLLLYIFIYHPTLITFGCSNTRSNKLPILT
jgi:trans-aconitate methyltransferase